MRVLPSDIIIIAKKIRNGLMGANPMGLWYILRFKFRHRRRKEGKRAK